MKQKDVGEPWERADGKVRAKWGRLTRAERVVFAERWLKRSVKLDAAQGIGKGEALKALAALHRKRGSFYPTLQDGNGFPPDDGDTPSTPSSPGDSSDRHVGGFDDWESESW